MAAPPNEAIAALLSPSSNITRRVDIYEENATTPFMLDAPFLDGNVSVDMGRNERRTVDMTFENIDGSLDNYPGGFWYDKVLKVYRGIEWEGISPSYLRIGTAGGHLRTADTPKFTLSGSTIFWRVVLSLDDLTGASGQTLLSKWNTAAGARSWMLRVTTAGTPQFVYSIDGSASVTVNSTSTLGSVGIVDGQKFGLQVTLFNGSPAGQKTWVFEYSVDLLNWIQLGSVVTDTSSATLPFDGSYDGKIGVNGASSEGMVGNLYSVQHYDDSRGVIDLDFTTVPSGEQGVTDQFSGTPWTMNNLAQISIAGGTIQDFTWETQVGEFLIDTINVPNFPHVSQCSGRDYTKKLLDDKFADTTTFVLGQTVEQVIKTIATNGNITKFLLSNTGFQLGKDFTFESGTDRWTAITEIATAYNLEAFFNAEGYLVLREMVDPLSAPLAFTFETGTFGNLVKYSKRSGDTRIYNHIVVRGEAADQLPIVAEAENHEPSSPTSIENLGRRRTYTYVSSFFTSEEQAQATADSFLKIKALETYDVALESIIIPWLEAGEAVEFIDPNPNPGDPTRFLLTDFSIPMTLGSMSATSKRVTVVGEAALGINPPPPPEEPPPSEGALYPATDLYPATNLYPEA